MAADLRGQGWNAYKAHPAPKTSRRIFRPADNEGYDTPLERRVTSRIPTPRERFAGFLHGLYGDDPEERHRVDKLMVYPDFFKYPPQAFDHMWHMIEENRHSPACHKDVVGTLKRQVAEIRSFRDEDVATAQIYLKNGECWNNFAVSTYLECAAAGAVDNLRIRPRPEAPPTIDWTDIRFFLWLGQSYE